jgi:hypothetical protein
MDAPALLKREGLECPLIAYTSILKFFVLDVSSGRGW